MISFIVTNGIDVGPIQSIAQTFFFGGNLGNIYNKIRTMGCRKRKMRV